ncbi:MAG: ATP phosphoribosyltransferase [bacterium]|nr:ATP phosphoribosyltransferase [bacterium]
MTLTDSNLKIAVQKQGRLTEKSLELLEGIGLDFDFSKDQLFARCRNFDLDLLFLRDNDIPEYVQDGVCDLGIVGRNMVVEKRASVTAVQKLGFGNCRLAIAVPESSKITSWQDLEGSRIATTYPNSLEAFLLEKKIKAEVICISGSAEIAPSLNLSDAICDLVSSGNTLRINGLRELELVFESQAVLNETKASLPDPKRQLINRLLLRVSAVLKAQRTKYVLMNAPESALEKIKAIIPGLDSPTVVPLAKPGMIAVHSVVDEEEFWEVIEQLKEVGATSILVSPIEKLIA